MTEEKCSSRFQLLSWQVAFCLLTQNEPCKLLNFKYKVGHDWFWNLGRRQLREGLFCVHTDSALTSRFLINYNVHYTTQGCVGGLHCWRRRSIFPSFFFSKSDKDPIRKVSYDWEDCIFFFNFFFRLHFLLFYNLGAHFLKDPVNYRGPVSHPVSPHKLFRCFSKFPLLSIPLILPVTCPEIYGRSWPPVKLPGVTNVAKLNKIFELIKTTSIKKGFFI